VRVLLDTCVLSELRRPKGHPAVRQAVAALDSEGQTGLTLATFGGADNNAWAISGARSNRFLLLRNPGEECAAVGLYQQQFLAAVHHDRIKIHRQKGH
jgi:hypothetical protein